MKLNFRNVLIIFVLLVIILGSVYVYLKYTEPKVSFMYKHNKDNYSTTMFLKVKEGLISYEKYEVLTVEGEKPFFNLRNSKWNPTRGGFLSYPPSADRNSSNDNIVGRDTVYDRETSIEHFHIYVIEEIDKYVVRKVIFAENLKDMDLDEVLLEVRK